MSRPVVTAIYLDELRRTGSPIRVPRNALITPAARDWFKDHAVAIEWQDENEQPKQTLAAVLDPAQASMRAVVQALERTGAVEVIAPAAAGAGPLASAVRRLCGKIARQEVTKGVVFTRDVGVALLIAGKHHGIRAVLGTSLPAVQDACRELAPNVLVIDAAGHVLFQTRQMIDRLLAAPTAPPPEMSATIESVERSGGREDW